MFEKLVQFKEEKIHKLLWKLTEKYPNKLRVIQVDGSNYLRRFYITPRRLNEHGEETGEDLGFGIYVQYFYRGDEDRELHNHPWNKSFSIILCGGYKEERRDNKTMKVYDRDINYFNIIRHTDFHRVILEPKHKHVWTLFFTGKRVQDWGFWDRETNEYTPHEKFVEKSEQGYIPK